MRYNKALFTNAATPIFCALLLIGIGDMAMTAVNYKLGEIKKFLIP